jgi:hypothetical protein
MFAFARPFLKTIPQVTADFWYSIGVNGSEKMRC